MNHILLIDDDEDMLAMTGRWLEKSGYRVSKAASGKAALEMIPGDRPDLILLDYAMPEMDGPAVLKAIRSDDSMKDIPVLYRTGMDDLCDGGDELSTPNGTVAKSEGRNALIAAVGNILA